MLKDLEGMTTPVLGLTVIMKQRGKTEAIENIQVHAMYNVTRRWFKILRLLPFSMEVVRMNEMYATVQTFTLKHTATKSRNLMIPHTVIARFVSVPMYL